MPREGGKTPVRTVRLTDHTLEEIRVALVMSGEKAGKWKAPRLISSFITRALSGRLRGLEPK